MRFKGHSSLQQAWSNDILKLSFKLDFDQYEDDYPQIDDQRFYGFKQLSLKNNAFDTSFMRDKVAADLFLEYGLAAAHTAFYTLYLDHGDGPIYFGLYTLVEEPDDTVIETQFSDDTGNLYKPDGTGASFASGSFSEEEFVKQTNEDEANWSDIEALFEVLHDSSRTNDATTWRQNLESVFDVDVFLKYLAVNTVIQNWDTYGRMTHNYYLYNNPDTGLLTWIPWDNNEALQDGKQGGSHSLDFSGLNAQDWPLIGYLYNDPVYQAQYDGYVQDFTANVFEESKMENTYNAWKVILEPYATSELSGYTFLSSANDFYSGVSALITHVASRNDAVSDYLNG